jgi:hypothetical protein
MTTETSPEDFLELELENFNDATNSADELDSYLCLGAVDATETHGDDLVALVTAESPVFIDDARVRGANDDADSPDSTASKNIFHTMTQTQRADESALLETKGGWRDHTDGNRITTTRGDKVEVIRGNYKLRVLGREQWTKTNNVPNGSGLHHESSGGITYQYDEVPGQFIDVRWEYDDTIKTWRVIEECTKGHTVTRYHGVDKDWMQGGDVVTRVGSLKAYDGTTTADDDDFITDTHFDRPTNPDVAHGADTTWPCDDVLPNMKEKVFAKKVYDKAVAYKIEEHVGSSTRPLTKLTENQYCTNLTESQTYDHFEQWRKGTDSYEYWFGPSYLEYFEGLNFTAKFHTYFDVRVGLLIAEFNFASIFEINLAALNISIENCGVKKDIAIAPTLTEVDVAGLSIVTNTRPSAQFTAVNGEAALFHSIT